MDKILLSGTSNPPLAAAVAKQLGLSLGAIEITRFIDNECRVYLKEDVKEKQVFILQSLSQIADQNLVELCLIGQAAKTLGAKEVVAVIPWMGYSKQDKEFRKGEAVSAQLVAKFIEVAGFDRVITIELHSEKVVPFFHVPVVELSTHKLLAVALPKKSRLSLESGVVVSPDKGGKSRAERFAKEGGLPIVYLEKHRDLTTREVKVTSASEDVRDHDIVIFDDIINTGATAVKTSEFLKAHGAGKIFFLATHAVLAGEASAILASSPIDEVIVTDTIAIPPEKKFSKLHVLTVASLLADAISSAQA